MPVQHPEVRRDPPLPPRGGEDEASIIDDIPTSSEGTDIWKVKQIDETSAHWAWRFPLSNLNKEERKQHFSRDLPLADHRWRVMVMDKHYLQQPGAGHGQSWISIYVDLVEAHTFQHSQQLQAHFAIILVNQDPEKNNRKESSHFFTCSEYDRGFAQFVTVEDVFNPAKGWIYKGPDGGDCLLIEVQVKDGSRPHYSPSNILKCPREHGFSVGLKNQGATCYLNSLMQTLFYLSYFRKSVYALPTEDDEKAEGRKSITLALQRLFCKMQLSDEPIETKELTESFGWNKEHAWQQHDIQELMRLLSDYLEKKMKGTESEGMFNQLFEGKTKAYVKCCNVPYESSREEPFYEVHVCVRDCADIYESLDREVQPERLDGDNKYDAEIHGKQPADKGTEFVKFPPVVFIHLKRFEFNFATEMQIKVNSRYEFYDEITLKPNIIVNLEGKGDRHVFDEDDTSNNYLLFAVMVHAGSAYGGHYYAFVKATNKEGKEVWLKYDDERVSLVPEQQAISDNFGGRDPNKWWEKERGESIRSAYMLLYVKKSEWSNYCFPLGEQDMPHHVREALLHEQKEEMQRKKEKEEQHRYFHFKIATEADFRRYDEQEPLHHDLYKFDNHPVVKFEKETKWQDFKERVAQLTGGSASSQRLWQWNRRNNKTNRPDTPLDKSRRNAAPVKSDTLLSDVFIPQQRGAHFADTDMEPFELFVEQGPDSSSPIPPLEADSALFLLKHYDPQMETLRYIGHYVCRSKTERLSAAKSYMNELISRPPDAVLDVYEEVRKTMIEKREWTKSVKEQELDHGDILIIQVPPDLIQASGPLSRPNATDFFTFLNEQVLVRFYPKADPTKESCKLVLLKTMDYATVCQNLSEKINVPVDYIRLYPMRSERDGPSNKPLTVEERHTLGAMTLSQKERDRILYWEQLSMPLSEMELKVPVTVVYFTPQVLPTAEVEILCDKDDTIADLLAKTQEQHHAPPGPLLALKVVACRIECDLPATMKVATMECREVRIEAPPEHPDPACEADEIQWGIKVDPKVWAVRAKDNSRLIQVQHIAPDTMNTPHSHPFFFWVLEDETADECKERLRLKIKQTEDTFKRWSLATYTGSFTAPYKFQGTDNVLEFLRDAEKTVQDGGEARLALIHKDPHKKSLYAGQALSLNVT